MEVSNAVVQLYANVVMLSATRCAPAIAQADCSSRDWTKNNLRGPGQRWFVDAYFEFYAAGFGRLAIEVSHGVSFLCWCLGA
jgi:hypothetical protein